MALFRFRSPDKGNFVWDTDPPGVVESTITRSPLVRLPTNVSLFVDALIMYFY